jgi:hypothetical protein
MTAKSFIAAEGRCSTQQFRHCLQGAGELLLTLNVLHAFKEIGLALLPRFNYPLSTLWAHAGFTGMNRNYKK